MKKRAFSIILAVLMLASLMPTAASAEGGVPITYDYFRSDAIRAILSEQYDIDGDGFLNDEELKNVTDISCPGEYVGSLDGIEYLTNLQYLDIFAFSVYGYDDEGNPIYYRDHGQVGQVDLSNNPELRYLNISGNGGLGIDLSKNTKLEVLIIGACPLETIDTSKMPNLKYLDVSAFPVLYSYDGNNCKSHIKSLDLSKNTKLEELYCEGAQLTELDVSHNPELMYLDCSVNKLTELDLSNNENLIGVDMSYNDFTDIDVAHNPNLELLYCANMGKQTALLKGSLDKLDVSHNPELMYLNIAYNSFTEFDLSLITKLVEFDCHYNNISSLDFSNNPDMLYINAGNNPLKTIDVSKLAELTYLDIRQEPHEYGEREGLLKEVNVTNNTKLEYLNCYHCGLKALDLSKNTLLTELHCQNSVPNLDLSANTELGEITIVDQSIRFMFTKGEDGYSIDIKALVGEDNFSRVSNVTGGSYNSETGILTLTESDSSASYVYDTGNENHPSTVYLNIDFNDITDKFVDMVPENHWAYESIKYVLKRGIMNGTGEDTFEPNGTVTRAMLAVMLYNLAGEPEVSGENRFTDVADDAWYTSSVIWANNIGIVSGNGDGTFNPNGAVTREQLAVMLCNFVEHIGRYEDSDFDVSVFADADSISSWALDAIEWACANGIINGSDEGGVMYAIPKGNATRCQIAVIFENLCKEYSLA